MNAVLRWLCVIAVIAQAGCATESGSPERRAKTSGDERRGIVLAGDSLVSEELGWGKAFAEQVGSKVDVVNASVGGQASSTYSKSAQWKRALDSHAALVLLELGTNDSPAFSTHHPVPPEAFAKNLKVYLNDARSRGIKLVLVTPLARRTFGRGGKIASDLLPYAQAVIELARATNTPCIDLHAWSVNYFERLGEAQVRLGSPRTEGGRIDTTHLAPPWQPAVASFIIAELRTIDPGAWQG